MEQKGRTNTVKVKKKGSIEERNAAWAQRREPERIRTRSWIWSKASHGTTALSSYGVAFLIINVNMRSELQLPDPHLGVGWGVFFCFISTQTQGARCLLHTPSEEKLNYRDPEAHTSRLFCLSTYKETFDNYCVLFYKLLNM